jgi:MinD superfamily P-loop ATPase
MNNENKTCKGSKACTKACLDKEALEESKAEKARIVKSKRVISK